MAALRAAKENFPENVSDFNSALSALNKDKEQLHQQQKDLDEEALDFIAFLADPEGLAESIQKLGEQIDPEDREVTSRFLRSFVNRVDIEDEEATMYYSMPLPNTVETPDGYKASAPIERGGPEILLEQRTPVDTR